MAVNGGKKTTNWGELFGVNYVPNVPMYDDGPTLGKEYGGAGLIYLGKDYSQNWDSGSDQYGQIDPYLTGASKFGDIDTARNTLNSQLEDVKNFSGSAYDELSNMKHRIEGVGQYSTGFTWSGGSGDGDTYSSMQSELFNSLERQAYGRQQYDQLVGQFNQVYTSAKQQNEATINQHNQRLAELDAQRQAAEAAAAQSRAWAANRPLQNQQNENLPDTVTSGTASSGDDAAEGDVGGKPRRRRGSLSSNLGINA